ncbi:hypothetical protein D6T65_16725 [Arthrobacter frigidicola]|nr:hypothetical protein D6T65_16725 [Arthrobacter frigidicola]
MSTWHGKGPPRRPGRRFVRSCSGGLRQLSLVAGVDVLLHVEETVKSADLDARKLKVVSYGVITE